MFYFLLLVINERDHSLVYSLFVFVYYSEILFIGKTSYSKCYDITKNLKFLKCPSFFMGMKYLTNIMFRKIDHCSRDNYQTAEQTELKIYKREEISACVSMVAYMRLHIQKYKCTICICNCYNSPQLRNMSLFRSILKH